MFESNSNTFMDKSEYLTQVLLLNDAFCKIRLSQIEARIYKNNTSKVDSYYNKIVPGSIVSVNNPEILIRLQTKA